MFIHGWTMVTISELLANSKVTQLCYTESRLDQYVVGLNVTVNLFAFIV